MSIWTTTTVKGVITAGDRLRALDYLILRHAVGVTRGELVTFVLHRKGIRAAMVQALLDELIADGLAVVRPGFKAIPAPGGGTFRRPLTLYFATPKLRDRANPAGPGGGKS